MFNGYLDEVLEMHKAGNRGLYNFPLPQMVDFIQEWFLTNPNYQDLFYAYPPSEKITLPYEKSENMINQCPRDQNHQERTLAPGGKLVCLHESVEQIPLKQLQSHYYYDQFARLDRHTYIHGESSLQPINAVHRAKVKKMNEEVISVYETCLAIIPQEVPLLSLETILQRLNQKPEFDIEYCSGPCQDLLHLDEECLGHNKPHPQTKFGFDSLALAAFVKAWSEQFTDQQEFLFH